MKNRKKRVTAWILSVLVVGAGLMPLSAQDVFAAPAGVALKAADGIPDEPENLSAKAVGEGQIAVSWDAAENSAGCYIYRGTEGQTPVYLDFVPGSGTAYVDSTAAFGTRYTYAVEAFDASGNVSGHSRTAEAVTYYPGTPVLDSAVAADGVLTVSWKEAAHAAGYYIYVKTADRWEKLGEAAGAKNLKYSCTAPADPSACLYTVRAYYRNGAEIYAGGYDRAGVRGLTHVDVPGVTIESAAKSGNNIKVTWNAVSGVTGYQIYRKTVSSDWKLTATVSGAANSSYTDSSVKKNIRYYYKICAFTTLGGKDYAGAFSGEKNASVGKTPELKSTASVYVGDKTTLQVKNNKKKVTWKSEDKSIATVSSKGEVSGKKTGTVRICAKIDGVKYYSTVTVKSSMTTSASSKLTLKRKKTKTIPVTFRLSGKLNYKLSKKTLVSVRFGRWKGDKISVYVKAFSKKGKVTLTITNNKTSEKLKFNITVK